jgi:hypothetical protein
MSKKGKRVTDRAWVPHESINSAVNRAAFFEIREFAARYRRDIINHGGMPPFPNGGDYNEPK